MVKKLKLFQNQEQTENTLHIEHEIPNRKGYFRSICLQLLEKKLTFNEIAEKIQQAESHANQIQRTERLHERIYKEIRFGIKKGFIYDKDGYYLLTEDGKKVTKLLEQAIIFNTPEVPQNSKPSKITIFANMVLSIVKLLFGILSGSSGLLTDGIKNTSNFLNFVLVTLGIKWKSEKLASLFIVISLYSAIIAASIITIYKFTQLNSLNYSLTTFIISIGCSFIMLGLSVYQYFVGQVRNSYEMLGHALNSRNRFIISLVVSLAILASILGTKFHILILLYLDPIIAVLIIVIMLFGTIALTFELFSSDEKDKRAVQFTQLMNRLAKRKIIYSWLERTLSAKPLTLNELDEQFRKDFFVDTQRIPSVFSALYQPSKGNELHAQLERLVELKTIKIEDGKYSFKEDSN